MPLPLHLARNLTDALIEARQGGTVAGLRSDGKAQVSVRYRNGMPDAVTVIVLSAQHDERIDLVELRRRLETGIADRVVPLDLRTGDCLVLVNPGGRFCIG